ncbi:MAG: hypothetical protein KGI54_18450 [Pseudomonadota bacterium]|nr:hypothetical protein [Pseudomonadota bacterium]
MASITFNGGGKLERVLREMAEKIGKAQTLKVGFMAGGAYPNKDQTSIPMVAAIQNYGAPAVGIPPRPFFSNMVAKESSHWGRDLAKILPSVDMDSDIALKQLGRMIGDELQQSIIDTNDPPLSPVTLMLRKMRSEDSNFQGSRTKVMEARQKVADGESYGGVNTKVLIDTGVMKNAVQYDVDGEVFDMPKKDGE